MSKKVPSAALLSIGDEVLRGDTVDTNQAFLGAELHRRGVRVALAVTIPDEMAVIVDWVRRLADGHDYVFSCGGIGSTPDDLTRPAMAAAFDRELVLYECELQEFEERRGRRLNPGQREMWRMPAGSELLWGQRVIVPGFRVANVYVFPGVPEILKVMWERIADRFSGTAVHCERFRSQVAESRFTPVMERFTRQYPEIKFGSYPKLEGEGRWSVELALHGTDLEKLRQIAAAFQAEIEALGPNPW